MTLLFPTTKTPHTHTHLCTHHTAFWFTVSSFFENHNFPKFQPPLNTGCGLTVTFFGHVLSGFFFFLGSVVVVKLSERADRRYFTASEKDPRNINHRSLGWYLNHRPSSQPGQFRDWRGLGQCVSVRVPLGFQLTDNICVSQCFTIFLIVQT